MRLPRRWSELGIRDLPSHDCNWLCAGWSITVHLPSSGEATPCVVHGADFVLLGYIVNKSSGLSRIEESLDHLDATTVCKAFECWAGSWDGPLMASPGHQENVRRDRPISYDTWSHRIRSTTKRQIGIVRTRCVHSISPVTDRIYRSSAVMWYARCNSRRTCMKWD